jgi:hypothetical protein
MPVFMRVCMCACGVAVNRWRTYVQQTKEHKKRLLTQTLLRLQQGSLWHAWLSWRDHTVEARHHAESVQQRKHYLLRHWLHRTQRGVLWRAWRGWREHVHEAQHKETVLQSTLLRLSQASLWR